MLIKIDDKEYVVTGEDQKKLIEALFSEAVEYYEKMSATFQVLIDQLARGMLYKAEKDMIAKGVSMEAAKLVRPAKKQSPSLKFLELLAENVNEPADKLVVEMTSDDGYINDMRYHFINKEAI